MQDIKPPVTLTDWSQFGLDEPLPIEIVEPPLVDDEQAVEEPR